MSVDIQLTSIAQVPEDLQSILDDSSLFNKESDITTKEILKRYGERSSNLSQYHPTTDPEKPRLDSYDSKPNGTRNGATTAPRASAPIITHVDNTDPSHSRTWPKESSVRHVQAPGGGPSHVPGRPNMTPPQAQFEYAEGRSPYMHQRVGSTDSQRSQDTIPNRQSYRQAGWVASVAAKAP